MMKTGWYISGTSINPYFFIMRGNAAEQASKLADIVTLAAAFVSAYDCFYPIAA